jgi:class 3 adenylate cyclase/tetratricopeptide (TPR) repeat protein
MECPNCRHENPDDAKFCNNCAAKLELTCPKCGKTNPSGSKFCNECAHSLIEPNQEESFKQSEPQSYTPKHLADKILTTRSSIEGERKLVTVLFADVANYTAMSEKLDPEEVHQIMDGCFKILMDEIHKYEGTINQFTGDGIMALFGAPVAHENHAQRACYAALGIQRAIGEYETKIEHDTGLSFKMRIGLNSGPVIVGAIGDDLRMDYTAVGDTTNLASRIESMAQPGSVLLSEQTYHLVRNYFELKSLGHVEVKGKEDPQKTYQLLKPSAVETRFEASVAKGLTKFVGRQSSMASLMEAYEKVVVGSGQVVGIVGEAGVGKSRFLLEFRNRIEGDFAYLEGRCIQFGGTMAFLPLLDILRKYCDIEEGEQEHLVKKKLSEKISGLDESFTWTLSPFQDLLSLKVEDEAWNTLEPQKKREKAFEAFRNLLVRESQERLLILAIEDLHWMDKSSEEFLGYFIDWIAGSRVLLLLLYRPEYSHQWGSKTYYSRIGLDQLTTNSSAELVQAVLGHGEIVPELRELILGRAAGNPLFMEELTHTLLQNGSIEKQDNRFVLSRNISDLQIPDTVQGIIAARMDRLEDNLKRTMQVAAVIGRDFAFRILQSITDMREELKSHLLNLQGLEFIYEKQLFPELEYIFKHALTQEVAYNSLLLKRRKEIHETIGRAIEQLYAERLEEFYEMLAYHYSKSDNLKKAYHYLKQSGIKAIGNHSAWEAYAYYRDAFDVLDRLSETEDNKEDQLELIDLAYRPMVYLAYSVDCLPMLKRAEEIYEEMGDARNLAKWCSIQAKYHVYQANTEESLAYSEKSYHLAWNVQDLDLMAETAPGLYLSYGLTGDYYKAVEIILPIIDLFEKANRQSEYFGHPYIAYCWLGGGCGSALAGTGNFKEGEALCQKALQVAKENEDLISLGFCELYLGYAYYPWGKWNQAKLHFKNSLEHHREIDFMSVKGWTLGALGSIHSFLGDFESANQYFEQGVRFFEDTGIEIAKNQLHIYMGTHYYESGDFNRARQVLDQALLMAKKINAKLEEGLALIYLGRTIGKLNPTNIKSGERHILEGINILEDLKMRTYYSQGLFQLGDLYADSGRSDEAHDYLNRAEENFQQMGTDFWLNRARETLSRL